MEQLEIINIADTFDKLLEDIGNRKKEPELPIRTIPSLNEIMYGIKKRKLTVIGARTSNGKSAFSVQICIDLASQGKKVVFFSLEMENMECAERLFAYELEINNKSLLRGEGYKLKERAQELRDKYINMNFMISDCLGRSWKEINDIIEAWHERKQVPDLIVLDYIQNIKGIGTQKEQYDEYIKKFREMAIRFNFAAVICSQVNRASQDTDEKSPQLHQLKGTGCLEEAADTVLLLHWPYFYDNKKDKNHFEVYLAKNKLGETGRINIRYYPEFYMFREISNENQMKEQPQW